MKFSKKGYLRNSPDVKKPQNIIEGSNITMKGVDFKVHGVDNNGYAKIMTPGNDYKFPNAKYVIETPIKNNKQMYSPFNKKFCGKSPLKQAEKQSEYAKAYEAGKDLVENVYKGKTKYRGLTLDKKVRESDMIPRSVRENIEKRADKREAEMRGR